MKESLKRWRSRVARIPLRVTVPLAVAALSGVAAYWLGLAYLEQSEAQLAQRYAAQHAVRTVLVAAAPLAAGARLDAANLARRQVPARYVPRSAFAPEAMASLRGRVLTHPLEAGEAVTPAVLAFAGAPALAQQLGAGERALTIAVDDTNSHAGLVRPGDLIDLLWVTDTGAAAGVDADAALAARPLLQAVRVLATGKTLRSMLIGGATGEADASTAVREFTTLTLLATPSDAARIAIAERAGELLVTLRAADDQSAALPDRLTLAGLLGSSAIAPARAPRNVHQIAGWVGGRGGASASHRWTVGASSSDAGP
jgi:pilus assembly protein CpaB